MMTLGRYLIRSILLITVLVTITECNPRHPINDDYNSRHSINDVTLSAAIAADPTPNKYRVDLTWTSHGEPLSWDLSREDGSSVPLHLATLEGKQLGFTDDQVEAGKSYRYVLGAMEGSGYRVVKDVSVSIYQDIELKRETLAFRRDSRQPPVPPTRYRDPDAGSGHSH